MKIDNIYYFLRNPLLPHSPRKVVQGAARTELFAARREKGPFISWIVQREARSTSGFPKGSTFRIQCQKSFDGFKMPFGSKAFLMPRMRSIFSGA